MTQRWKTLIALSILLNVLLIGILIGKATSPLFPKFPPPPGMFDEHGLLRGIMEKSMIENRGLDSQIMKLKHQMNQLLAQKNIDHNQFEKLAQQMAKLHNQKFKNMTENFYTAASQLPLEKRQQLVKELEELPPPPGFRKP